MALGLGATRELASVHTRVIAVVRIENRGKVDRHFRFSRDVPAAYFGWTVLGPDGKLLPRLARARERLDGLARWGGPSGGLAILRPGNSVELRVVLSEEFDLSKPGMYVVSVQRGVLPHFSRGEKNPVYCKSGSVSVRLP